MGSIKKDAIPARSRAAGASTGLPVLPDHEGPEGLVRDPGLGPDRFTTLAAEGPFDITVGLRADLRRLGELPLVGFLLAQPRLKRRQIGQARHPRGQREVLVEIGGGLHDKARAPDSRPS
jgi:hypothetical protein